MYENHISNKCDLLSLWPRVLPPITYALFFVSWRPRVLGQLAQLGLVASKLESDDWVELSEEGDDVTRWLVDCGLFFPFTLVPFPFAAVSRVRSAESSSCFLLTSCSKCTSRRSLTCMVLVWFRYQHPLCRIRFSEEVTDLRSEGCSNFCVCRNICKTQERRIRAGGRLSV